MIQMNEKDFDFDRVPNFTPKLNEKIFVIDQNGVDLWAGIVKSIKNGIFLVHFPDFPNEDETFQDECVQRILKWTKKNEKIYKKQELIRKNSPKIDDESSESTESNEPSYKPAIFPHLEQEQRIDEISNSQNNESKFIDEVIDEIQCPICYFAMTPPSRIPMINPECGHTICSECASKVESCPLCKKSFTKLIKNALVNDIAENLQKNSLLSIDINPPLSTENKLIPKIEVVCTYFATGEKSIRQRCFQCKTCNISGICEICADTCHKEHDIYLVRPSPEFYCHCGSNNDKCCCKPKDQNLRCTSEMTYGYPVEQPMYQCYDCKVIGEYYLCQHCAIKCHYAHKLRYIGILNDKICHCYILGMCTIAQKRPYCSYVFTGSTYPDQQFYFCKTCKLSDVCGCCAACSRNCHKGHKIEYNRVSAFYCDCGEGNIKTCVKCKINTFPNTSYLNCCTNIDPNHKNEPKEQRMYHCYSCGVSGNYGICEACAINCHINHSVKYIGTQNFICACSENCKMKYVPILHNDRNICDRIILGDDDSSACYVCNTCDPNGEKQICETCAMKRHTDHDIHLVGYMSFKCYEGGVFE